jgi:hypothetical protein
MRIFGPKREKLTGKWRKLHIEEVHNLCSSQNIIRMRRTEHVIVRMEEMIHAYTILVRKPERQKPFRRYKNQGVRMWTGFNQL